MIYAFLRDGKYTGEFYNFLNDAIKEAALEIGCDILPIKEMPTPVKPATDFHHAVYGEPSADELKQKSKMEAEEMLSSTDFKILKLMEEKLLLENPTKETKDLIAARQAARSTINLVAPEKPIKGEKL